MKLESEVGLIRYIAEFVYGEEADRNLLEEAVRWDHYHQYLYLIP